MIVSLPDLRLIFLIPLVRLRRGPAAPIIPLLPWPSARIAAAYTHCAAENTRTHHPRVFDITFACAHPFCLERVPGAWRCACATTHDQTAAAVATPLPCTACMSSRCLLPVACAAGCRLHVWAATTEGASGSAAAAAAPGAGTAASGQPCAPQPRRRSAPAARHAARPGHSMGPSAGAGAAAGGAARGGGGPGRRAAAMWRATGIAALAAGAAPRRASRCSRWEATLMCTASSAAPGRLRAPCNLGLAALNCACNACQAGRMPIGMNQSGRLRMRLRARQAIASARPPAGGEGAARGGTRSPLRSAAAHLPPLAVRTDPSFAPLLACSRAWLGSSCTPHAAGVRTQRGAGARTAAGKKRAGRRVRGGQARARAGRAAGACA